MISDRTVFLRKEIREFFQLAKQYHPDVNKSKDANARFQEVSEAYEVSQTIFHALVVINYVDPILKSNIIIGLLNKSYFASV